MSIRKTRAGLAAVAAAGLITAYGGSAVAQQTPTTTTPIPNEVVPATTPPTPSTTIAPAATPQGWSRYDKVKFAGQGASPKHLTAGAQMTKDDTAPTRGYTAPTSMLADPSNPKVVIAAVAELRGRTCHLVRSTDAGRTWHFTKTPPSPAGYPFCTSTMAGVPEVSIAWGRNHTLYYGLMAYDIVSGQEGPRDGRTSIALARSTDLGDSWTFTMVDNLRGQTDQASGAIPSDTGVTGLSVDSSGPHDVVSVGFSRSYSNAPTGSPLNSPHPMVATSTDDGRTFPAAVDLNTFTNLTRTLDRPYKIIMRTGFGAPFLTAHNGVILAVAGSDFTPQDQPAPPHGAGQGLSPGTFYAYPNPQVVARSTDQGKTWTVKELGPPIYAGTGSMTGLGWTAKGGAKGTFVAVYAGTPETSTTTGIADMVVQRSTDSGLTWSAPLAISDDKPDQFTTSFYPQLQVAPNGRVDAVWLDNRNQADFRFNVRYSYSNDGGTTWAPNVQISDRPVDFNYGISFNSDIRFPPGVASSKYYAAVGWSDTRLATDVSQSQDAFGSVAQFSAQPATTNTTLPIVAGAFGGLLVAGVILLLILTARRRKTEPAVSPSGARPARREPIGADEVDGSRTGARVTPPDTR
jgi:hypothetical protein